MSYSAHLYSILNPYERPHTLDWLYNTLKSHVNKFDAIAVSGASGLLAASVADRLGKNIIIVRKSDDLTASDLQVEGHIGGGSPGSIARGRLGENPYVIVDDLVHMGTTCLRIMRKIREECSKLSECVGLMLYHNREEFWGANEVAKKLKCNTDEYITVIED